MNKNHQILDQAFTNAARRRVQIISELTDPRYTSMQNLLKEKSMDVNKVVQNLKDNALKEIGKEAQHIEAEQMAGNFGMRSYHQGRMEVWKLVHQTLVNFVG